MVGRGISEEWSTERKRYQVNDLSHAETIKLLERDNRFLVKRNDKLQQQLNRIKNLTIGNTRIWEFDRLAMELEIEAELLLETHDANDDMKIRRIKLLADALFLRRVEFDLGEIHIAVHGDTNRRGGKYDQANWKGPRP